MMRSPITMFAELETGLREIQQIRVRVFGASITDAQIDAEADALREATLRLCDVYAELEQHGSALEDMRDLLAFTYGGDVS